MDNKTTSFNPKAIKTKWHFIDAADQTLGHLATKVSKILLAKDKAEYSPHLNIGDKVVVTNVEKIKVTGKKLTDKLYRWHTRYPTGLKSESLERRLERKPQQVLLDAISGMLPKNKLRKHRLTNLFLYKGSTHPHEAQQKDINLTTNSNA